MASGGRSEWGHGIQDGVEQDGSIHLSSPYSVLWLSQRERDLNLGEGKCLDSHPLLLQPFACPGLLGTAFLTTCSKTPSFCCLRFHSCCCTSCTVLAREERGGEARRAARFLPAAVTAQRPWWMPGPAAGHCLPCKEETGSGLPVMDASEHPRVRSDTCLAAGQGAVLFALPLGKQSTSLGKCHPPHPAVPASRCVEQREIFHLAFPLCRKGRQIRMRALPGSGGDGFTLLRGEGVTGKEVLE